MNDDSTPPSLCQKHRLICQRHLQRNYTCPSTVTATNSAECRLNGRKTSQLRMRFTSVLPDPSANPGPLKSPSRAAPFIPSASVRPPLTELFPSLKTNAFDTSQHFDSLLSFRSRTAVFSRSSVTRFPRILRASLKPTHPENAVFARPHFDHCNRYTLIGRPCLQRFSAP